eukprot:COSAG01_NODE_57194_length_313_cov_4.182243_1_plen_54_part_01
MDSRDARTTLCVTHRCYPQRHQVGGCRRQAQLRAYARRVTPPFFEHPRGVPLAQ